LSKNPCSETAVSIVVWIFNLFGFFCERDQQQLQNKPTTTNKNPENTDDAKMAISGRRQRPRRVLAHERASSTLRKVVAFASRSFTPPFTVFSGLRST
jgi:hypothetical protein